MKFNFKNILPNNFKVILIILFLRNKKVKLHQLYFQPNVKYILPIKINKVFSGSFIKLNFTSIYFWGKIAFSKESHRALNEGGAKAILKNFDIQFPNHMPQTFLCFSGKRQGKNLKL